MRATLSDGTGWVLLDACKEFIGPDGQMLYRTPCGYWLLMAKDTYHRVDQDTAHRFLEEWGFYPRALGSDISQAL